MIRPDPAGSPGGFPRLFARSGQLSIPADAQHGQVVKLLRAACECGDVIHALRLYTLLVTLITVLMMILGNLLDRDRVFSYDAFVSPLFYALIGTVATVITRSDRELSVRSLIIRKAVSLLLIEGAVILIALKADAIPTDQSWVIPGLALGVFAVFVLTHVILYLIDKKEAEKLNADLARFQEKQMNG